MPSVRVPGPAVRWLVLAAAALCVAAGFAAPSLAQALQQPLRQVFIHGVAPEAVELATRERTVAGALAEAGVELVGADRVVPDTETALLDETHVFVTPAVPVVLRVDGEEHILRSSAAQVRDLLAEQGVALGAQDRVTPELDTLLEYGLAVRVVRVNEQLEAETQEIPYATEYRDDPNLIRGETRVVRAGEPGTRETVTRRIYQDGRMLRAEPAGERVLQAPASRVVARGTAGVVSRGGNQYRYRQELTMAATAYSPGDGHTPGTLTATGIPARKGVVAVDPKVIPLGTRLYVEGYGVALAADTGGAIKGKRIDLAYDTPAEARRFGRRTIKVYVLAD